MPSSSMRRSSTNENKSTRLTSSCWGRWWLNSKITPSSPSTTRNTPVINPPHRPLPFSSNSTTRTSDWWETIRRCLPSMNSHSGKQSSMTKQPWVNFRTQSLYMKTSPWEITIKSKDLITSQNSNKSTINLSTLMERRLWPNPVAVISPLRTGLRNIRSFCQMWRQSSIGNYIRSGTITTSEFDVWERQNFKFLFSHF